VGRPLFGPYRRSRTIDPMIRSLVGVVLLGALMLVTPACHHTIDPDVRLQQGLAAQRGGDLDAAQAAYLDVLDVRPYDKYALYNLGVIANTEGNSQLAEGYYRSALDTDASFQPALFNLAIIRTGVGATSEAISLYRRLIAVASKNAAAHFNLALLLQRTGKATEATSEFNVAFKIDPSLADRLASSPIQPGTSVNGGVSSTSASPTRSATVSP
jgi:tetratricopeptide (TPR) repeat protein